MSSIVISSVYFNAKFQKIQECGKLFTSPLDSLAESVFYSRLSLGWILLGAAVQVDAARVIPAITVDCPPECYCTESRGEADCSVQELVEYPFYAGHVFENIVSLDISDNRIPKVALHALRKNFPTLAYLDLTGNCLTCDNMVQLQKFFKMTGDCIKRKCARLIAINFHMSMQLVFQNQLSRVLLVLSASKSYPLYRHVQ